MSNQATAEKTQEQAGNGFIPSTVEETSLPAIGQDTASAIVFDERAFAAVERLAQIMASGRATVPEHLRENVGDCMAVTMQALQWGMNPWPVAQKTHLVSGVLGYEAQLVNAVINSMAPTKDRIHYEWYGDWSRVLGKFEEKRNDKGKPYRVPNWGLKDEEGLGVRVWATLKGEDEPRELDLLLTQARTRNSTLWADDPRQQLAYLAVKRWSRLYCPDVILGVYTPDEIDNGNSQPREVNPRPTGSDDTGGSRPRSRTNSVKDKARAKTQQRPPIDAEAEPVPQESAPAAEEQPATTWADMSVAIDEAQSAEQLKAAVAHVDQLNDEERSRAKLSYTLRKGELQGLPVAIEVQDDVPHVVNTETGEIYA